MGIWQRSKVIPRLQRLLGYRRGRRSGLKHFSVLWKQPTLPDPSIFSANAVPFTRQPTGATHYIGNRTDYALLTERKPAVGTGNKSAPTDCGVIITIAVDTKVGGSRPQFARGCFHRQTAWRMLKVLEEA